MWPSRKVSDKGDSECQWEESGVEIGRWSWAEPNMTFVFRFLGNPLVHAPVIEDGWKMAQGGLGSVTWEHWTKPLQEFQAKEVA